MALNSCQFYVRIQMDNNFFVFYNLVDHTNDVKKFKLVCDSWS